MVYRGDRYEIKLRSWPRIGEGWKKLWLSVAYIMALIKIPRFSWIIVLSPVIKCTILYYNRNFENTTEYIEVFLIHELENGNMTRKWPPKVKYNTDQPTESKDKLYRFKITPKNKLDSLNGLESEEIHYNINRP